MERPNTIYRQVCLRCKTKSVNAFSYNMLYHKLFDAGWIQQKSGAWKCPTCIKLKPFIKKAVP